MGAFKRIVENLRFALWWKHLIPPVLATIYFTIAINGTPFTESLIQIIGFIPVIIGVAGLGYCLNDLSDYKDDQAVGKKNIVLVLSKSQLLLLILFLIGCISFPWLYLDLNQFVALLLGAQLIVYLLYSFPPLRFKERGMLGILSDAFYGHVNPILVTIFTFVIISETYFWDVALYPIGLIVFWAMSKGIRNIMLHQLDDRKNDLKTGSDTFVLRIGALKSVNKINRLILPIEITLVSALVFMASTILPFFYVGFLVFLFFTWLKFNGPKFLVMPRRQFTFKFLYFMNNFYEEWLAILILMFLSLDRPVFLVLLVIHLILFPHIPRNFYLDLKDIGKNLREL
ncbi:MAG TPA: hypothetical protein EYN38_11535 [Flavobacteriales bacterium]|nr:hypothetical protein [Flavobacteriales bacterium]HIO73725.1 hypothetical protein [Flavobacteriales bacterium]